MQRINITLTDKQMSRLRAYSEETEITISELLRRLIDGFFWQIDRQEPDPYGEREELPQVQEQKHGIP